MTPRGDSGHVPGRQGSLPRAGKGLGDGFLSWDGHRRETEMERIDRNFGELLQELRLAQTGVQLLIAFLLSIAFSPRFVETTSFQRGVYFATLLLALAATVLLIAPVSHHRLVFQLNRKRELVKIANKEAMAGLALLALALLGALMLITDLLFDGAVVALSVTGGALLFAVSWLGLPLRDRGTRSERVNSPTATGTP